MRDFLQGCLSAESGDTTAEGNATNKAVMVRKESRSEESVKVYRAGRAVVVF